MTPPVSAPERGVSLVTLMAGIAIMLIAMTVVAPTWSYVMQNEREEELLFRGRQMAEAINAYQQRHRTLPPSLEMLVKSRPRVLRRLYKDPMTPKGEWRLLRPGEPCPAPKAGTTGGGLTPIASSASTGTSFGAIAGVASRSTAKSLRLFNGQEKYNDWCFFYDKTRTWYIGKKPPTTPTGTGAPGTTPSPGHHP